MCQSNDANKSGQQMPDTPCSTAISPCPATTCSIISSTKATSPANLARTKIGVGEEVELTYTPGSAAWTIAGSGTLSVPSGVLTIFTAADTAGSVTVTATGSGGSCSITFTVVTPDSWNMKRRTGTNVWHTLNTLDNGWYGTAFLHPNDVNFYRVEVREKDSQAVTTGAFSFLSGAWHGHYPPPDRVSPWIPIENHADSDGSSIGSWDTIYARCLAANNTTSSPFIPGTINMPIIWQWRVTAMATVTNLPATTQEHDIAVDGTCTSRKAGNTEHSAYSDPTSTP